MDDNAASLDIWLVRVLRTLLVERSVTQTALRLNQTQRRRENIGTAGTDKQKGASYFRVYLRAEFRTSGCRLLPWEHSLLNRCGSCWN